MTLSPVISGAPAQAASRNRPSEVSDDKSKDFYSYLRSSAHDASEESPKGSVRESAAKTDKGEKQISKKTDTGQTTDAIAAPVPPPAEQPAPLLSIAALLGLPTIQKTDVAETGKTTNDDGKAVLALDGKAVPSLSDAGSDQQPAANTGAALLTAKPDSLDNTALTFTNTKSKGDAQPKMDKSQSPRKDRDANVNAVAPAALLSATAPQLLEIVPPQENSKMDPVASASSAAGSETSDSSVELLATGASPSGTASAPAPGNLAFALRLSEGALNSKLQQHSPQDPAAELTAAAVQSGKTTDLATIVGAAAGSQLKEQSQQHEGGSGTAFYEVPQTHPQNISDAPQLTSEQPAHATAAGLEAKQEMAGSEPVRNVHMQVIGDNNNRVDVRLMDRGGELHVSVKSGDVNLAQNLQDHMPELTSRLEQQQFQTEVWIPKVADNGKSEMSGARDFSSSGNNHSNCSNTSDRQGKGQQQHQPDWVDVLENSTRRTGKIDQTWLQ